MLHMVVMIHGPETCAAVDTASAEMARKAMEMKEEVAKRLQCFIKGAWVDAPAHCFFLLVDAPNAHVVNQAMIELKFMNWNTVHVHPVVTLEEAMSLATR